MNIFESIHTAISNVWSNKMRTFLTMIGVIIGVSSVIMIVSLGNGFKATVAKTFSMMNKNALTIYPSWETDFTNDTLDTLENNKNVKYASGNVNLELGVKLRDGKEKYISSQGTSSNYAKIQKNFFDMLHGRSYSKREDEAMQRVCVINEKLAKDIFGYTDVVGEKINLYSKASKNDTEFEIIGVSKMTDVMFNQQIIFIPVNTALNILGSRQVFNTIELEKTEVNSSKTALTQIKRVLSANYKTKYDDFYISSASEDAKEVEKVINTFTLFMSFVAGIALLVGGIGVMNIMLVTVTERTREIGIKMAIGAKKREIRTQFLVEAMFICLLGGIIGVIIGYLGAQIFGEILSVPIETSMGTKFTRPSLSIGASIIAMLSSMVVGIIFGVYPASKASKLNPIEALRYE